MSDDEERIELVEDDLANRRRLDRMQRSGAAPAAAAVSRRVEVAPVEVTLSRSCIGCGVIVQTIRMVHVECQRCEGDRNRKTHEAITKAIQTYKAHPTDSNWRQVRDLCGAGYADGLRTAMSSKGDGPKRPRREEF